MFGLGYSDNDDETKSVIPLDGNYANFETAKAQGKVLVKHPAYFHRTVYVIDHSTGRGYIVR